MIPYEDNLVLRAPLPDPRYGTAWPRFWAGFIDGSVLQPLMWLDGWIWSAFHTPLLLVPWFVSYSMSFVAYSVLLHWRWGQTLGKRVTGVRVHSLSGSPFRCVKLQCATSSLSYLALSGYSSISPTWPTARTPIRTQPQVSLASVRFTAWCSGLRWRGGYLRWRRCYPIPSAGRFTTSLPALWSFESLHQRFEHSQHGRTTRRILSCRRVSDLPKKCASSSRT